MAELPYRLDKLAARPLSLFATYGAPVVVFGWGWFADVLGIAT